MEFTPAQADQPLKPKVIKEYPHSDILEDDFGFSVRRWVTHAHWTPGDLELFGEKLKLTAELNRTSPDSGLEYDDAVLLALRIEAAWKLIQPDTGKRKRK